MVMAILVRDPAPVELVELVERRRALGQDLLDEVWDGVLHMNPAPTGGHAQLVQQLAELLGGPARAAGLLPMLSIFNLGEPTNYRVPDGGLLRESGNRVFYPTAALVVEVVSPGDESWEKLGFYASSGVEEVLIVDPQERSARWLVLSGAGYEPRDRSALIDLSAADLEAHISWPEPSAG